MNIPKYGRLTTKSIAARIKRDGRKHHPLYSTWVGMKVRCYYSTAVSYKNYGGRGIKVCDRWMRMPDGFWNFVNDMGERPNRYTLDRIDNNKGYFPENCKWVSRNQQMSNRRNSSKLYVGVTYSPNRTKGYRATFFYNGTYLLNQWFATIDEAICARKQFEDKYGN